MVAKTELESLKVRFLAYIATEQGKSKKTVENYTRYLNRFLASTRATQPKDITLSVVEEYRRDLATPHGSRTALKYNTQNYHLTALRRFLTYLRKQHVSSLEPEKVKLTPVHTSPVQGLSLSETHSLLQASQGRDNKSLRDRAILLLLSSTGVRVSELCALNVSSFSGDELVVQGTGARVRSILLSPDTKEALHAYLEARSDTSDALFVNNGKRVSSDGDLRLCARQVQRIVKQCATQVGLECEVTPQILRGAYAQNMLKNGSDVECVQELLGHQHIASTKSYVSGE